MQLKVLVGFIFATLSLGIFAQDSFSTEGLLPSEVEFLIEEGILPPDFNAENNGTVPVPAPVQSNDIAVPEAPQDANSTEATIDESQTAEEPRPKEATKSEKAEAAADDTGDSETSDSFRLSFGALFGIVAGVIVFILAIALAIAKFQSKPVEEYTPDFVLEAGEGLAESSDRPAEMDDSDVNYVNVSADTKGEEVPLGEIEVVVAAESNEDNVDGVTDQEAQYEVVEVDSKEALQEETQIANASETISNAKDAEAGQQTQSEGVDAGDQAPKASEIPATDDGENMSSFA